MDAILGGVLGLVGAIVGGLIASRAASRTAQEQWEREAQTRFNERLQDQLVALVQTMTHVPLTDETVNGHEVSVRVVSQGTVITSMARHEYPDMTEEGKALLGRITTLSQDADPQEQAEWLETISDMLAWAVRFIQETVR